MSEENANRLSYGEPDQVPNSKDNTPNSQEKPYVITIDGFSSKSAPNSNDWLPTGRPQASGAPKPDAPTSIEAQMFDSGRQTLEKASTQLFSDSDINYGVNGLVEPTFNLDALMELNNMSVIRKACIEAIATNTVRLGYRIKKTSSGYEEQDSDKVSEQIIDLLEDWAEQDDSSFCDVMYNVIFDRESCGNGYLEVTRDRVGRISGLHHIPGKTIRIKRDKSGWVQVVGTKRVDFYNFGDIWKINEDGSRTLHANRNTKLREIIPFQLYGGGDSYYGVPRDLAAINTIIGDELARNHNTKFFTHSATPELLLVFEVDKAAIPQAIGTQPVKVHMPDTVKREIEDHFRRTLSGTTLKPGIVTLPPGVKLHIERLSSEQKDAGWINYRKDNRNEIRMAFRTPPAIVTDTGAGDNANSLAEKALYLEQMIQPEQESLQRRLMAKFWRELTMVEAPEPAMTVDAEGDVSRPAKVDISPTNGTGVNRHIWKLEFKRMAIADAATLAQIHNIYGTLGVVTKNEIRADIDKKPMANGDTAPVVKPGAEGNALAQNADLKQVAAGNPDSDLFVTNKVPHRDDITGLNGIPGRGRGPTGMVSAPMPRRVGENGIPVAANLFTAGTVNKGDDPILMTKEAYDYTRDELRKAHEEVEELRKRLVAGRETEPEAESSESDAPID